MSRRADDFVTLVEGARRGRLEVLAGRLDLRIVSFDDAERGA